MNAPREPGGTVVPLPTHVRPAPAPLPFMPPLRATAPASLAAWLDGAALEICAAHRRRGWPESHDRVLMDALRLAAVAGGAEGVWTWRARRRFARALLSAFERGR